MGNRITLITDFDKNILYKIAKMIEQPNIETCKVPYGTVKNEDRLKVETLP